MSDFIFYSSGSSTEGNSVLVSDIPRLDPLTFCVTLVSDLTSLSHHFPHLLNDCNDTNFLSVFFRDLNEIMPMSGIIIIVINIDNISDHSYNSY
jgi:hypothetical protein